MKDEWLEQCLLLSRTKADFYSGARKIIRNVHFTIEKPSDDLTLADCGFTKSKQSMLVRNYLNEESRDAGLKLWRRRVEQAKYGSVGVSTYNHFVKGGGHRSLFAEMHEKRRAKEEGREYKIGRASVMGPCIQSFVLTLLNDKSVAVDVFYRTTELFKKFPADLVFLRDVLLPPFKLGDRLREINFHFANVTCHPMYFVTIIPLLDDPIEALEKLRKKDQYFFNWIVKWTARYVCDEHHRGIAKFAQAMRTCNDARRRIPRATMKPLQKYLRANHPGYRNAYEDQGEDE